MCEVTGCDPGLECDAENNVCVCEPFSSHPMCGCTGRYRPDPNKATTITCTVSPTTGMCLCACAPVDGVDPATAALVG